MVGWGRWGGCTVDVSKSGVVKNQLRFGSWNPIFLQGFYRYPGWLALGFLNHQQCQISSIYIYIHIGLGGSVFLFFPDCPSTNCKNHGSFWGNAIHTKMGEVDRIEISDRCQFVEKKTCQFQEEMWICGHKWGCEANLGIGERGKHGVLRKKHPLNYHQHMHPTSINHNSNTANPLTWRNPKKNVSISF